MVSSFAFEDYCTVLIAVATLNGAEASQNAYPGFAFTDPLCPKRSGQSYNTQPFISMRDLPNPPQTQSPKATSVAETSDRSQGVEFRLSDYQWQHRTIDAMPMHQQEMRSRQ